MNPDEKLAIVQGELTEYLATMRAQDKIFEMAAEGSNRDEEDGVLSSSGQDKKSEDSKRSEAVSPVPRMIDSQSVDKDW